MTADHGDNPNRHTTGGDPSGPSRFDIVLRGYDRRQVEDHIGTLERTITRQRSELEQARGSGSGANGTSQDSAGARPGSGSLFNPPTGQKAVAEGSGSSRDGALTPEMISSFTTRLQSILQAAEEEAEEVRGNARAFAHAEEQAGRARLEELERRRQAVLSELGRVRTQLDGLLGQPEPAVSAPAGPPNTGSGPESGAVATEVVRAETGSRPAPPRSDSGRSDLGRSDLARPEGGRPEGGRPEGGPDKPSAYPLPQRQSPNRPTAPVPPPSGGRPPAPQPAGQAPRPVQQPGQPAGPPSPPPSQGSGHPQSKPRPSPSPRPRTSPPTSNLPGKDMPAGKPGQGSRNGSAGHDNGAHDNGGRDDDGRSAFGSGAR